MGLLSALVDIETRRLHDYRWSTHFNERTHALELFRSLRPGDAVVMDRGYFSRELLKTADRLGVKVLFRLKRDAIRQVTAWTKGASGRRLPRTRHLDIAGVPCRLFCFRACGTRFLCLTTMNKPVNQLRDTYRLRWRVETFFRSLKSNLHFRNLRTTSAECFAHILDITTVLYNTLHRAVASTQDPSTHPRPPRRRGFAYTGLPLALLHLQGQMIERMFGSDASRVLWYILGIT